MNAGIITIGDELMIGQVLDTNSQEMAVALDKIGAKVTHMLSIPDESEAIEEAMEFLLNKVDLVLITGGLGPTKDDITKKVFASFFDDVLIRNLEVQAHVETLFSRQNFAISQVNLDQALVPSRCEVIFNECGTAPGMWMKKEKTVFVSMPGVPYEMRMMLHELLIPRIKTYFKQDFVVHQTIRVYGIGESMLAEQIAEWENQLPSEIRLSYLPTPQVVRLRMTTRGEDIAVLQSSIKQQMQFLQKYLQGLSYINEEEGDLVTMIVQYMQSKQMTLSLAESCTGGRLAAEFTKVAGVSSVFRGGVVPYATEMKVELLQVSEKAISDHSVVSCEVAEEMAALVKEKFMTTFAIATTGNAGPSKGDSSKEVGTVCIALATPKGIFSKEFYLGQPREKVLDKAVSKALMWLYEEILKN